MNREEALKVIKEIFERCREIEGKSLTLLPPKDRDELSNTFQIRIRTTDPILKSCVEDIVKGYDLVTLQEENFLVVYKHHPDSHRKESKNKQPSKLLLKK